MGFENWHFLLFFVVGIMFENIIRRMVFCMNAIKTYGNYIKKYAEPHPAVSRKMIDIGLHLEQFRTEHFAAKEMPKAYRKHNTLGVKNTLSLWSTGSDRLVQSLRSGRDLPVFRLKCPHHGMSFLVLIRFYLRGLFYRPCRAKGDRLHALLLPQKFHRCRKTPASFRLPLLASQLP